MLLDKQELAKISIVNKILSSKMTEEEINELNAGIVFSDKNSYIIFNNNKDKIQVELKVQNVTATSQMSVKMKDLITLVKTFTKKTTIELTIGDGVIICKGMQDKEEKTVELSIVDSKAGPRTRCETSTIDASNLLVSLSTITKIIKDIPQINSEALLEVTETHHKLTFTMFTDVELLTFSQITDNETRSEKLFLTKDETKFLVDIIKNLKSLEINIGLVSRGYIVSANGIDILVIIKPKSTTISATELINKVLYQANFLPLKFEGMDIDMSLQKDYVHVKRNGEKFILTNKPTEKAVVEYSYRINKVAGNKLLDIDLLQYDKNTKILMIDTSGLKYFIMPKKDTTNS